MRAPSDSNKGQRGHAERDNPVEQMTVASIMRSRLFRKYVGLLIAVVALVLVANSAVEIWFRYQDQRKIRFLPSSAAKRTQPPARSRNSSGKSKARSAGRRSCRGRARPWKNGGLMRFGCFGRYRRSPRLWQRTRAAASICGFLELDWDRLGGGADISNDPAFSEAMAHKVYYGPVYFHNEPEPFMTLALAGARRDAGVTIAQVNLKFINDALSRNQSGRSCARLCG